jgi:hypothetical protein
MNIPIKGVILRRKYYDIFTVLVTWAVVFTAVWEIFRPCCTRDICFDHAAVNLAMRNPIRPDEPCRHLIWDISVNTCMNVCIEGGLFQQ